MNRYLQEQRGGVELLLPCDATFPILLLYGSTETQASGLRRRNVGKNTEGSIQRPSLPEVRGRNQICLIFFSK